jgi:hypothetical protein
MKKPTDAIVSAELAAEKSTVAADPFDVASLRLSQDFASEIAVERVLTRIPVRKPGKQDFIRVHPSESYRLDTAIIELRDDRETYLVLPAFRTAVLQEIAPVRLYTAITRQGTLFLWPCKLPSSDGRRSEWHTSAIDAAGLAMERWTRIQSDMNAGSYQTFVAAGNLSEPEWPDLPFQELLRLAFRERLIDRLDHPVLERLRGAV